MRIFLSSILLLFFVLLTGTALAKAAGLKVVEQYEYDSEQYDVNPLKAKRHLSNLSFYNRLGNVVERWDITNYADGAKFDRHVLTYDRHGRMIADIVYTSTRTAPGQYFSISRGLRSIAVIPELPDSISSVTIKRYDARGNLIELRISDAEGRLQQRLTYSYDAHKNPLTYRNEKEGGIVVCESTTKYSADRLSSVQTYRNCGMNAVSEVRYRRDTSGRPILEEQYSQAANGSLVLTSRSVRTYSSDLTKLDWTTWQRTGEPSEKLLIVDKGDTEISRRAFAPTVSSPDSKLSWRPTDEEFTEITVDGTGNVTREIRRRRKSPDTPFRVVYAVERIASFL